MSLSSLFSSLFPGGAKKNDMPPLSTHHVERKVELMQKTFAPDSVAIVGDSHAEIWTLMNHDHLLKQPCNNFGVGGDLTDGVVDLLPLVVQSMPKWVILSIGSNNLGWNTKQSIAAILPETQNILSVLLNIPSSPTVFMHTILPIANQLEPNGAGGRTPENLTKINQGLFTMSQMFRMSFGDRVQFIQHNVLLSENFELKHELTYDHYHLNDSGYELWASLLNPYL